MEAKVMGREPKNGFVLNMDAPLQEEIIYKSS